jgi:hypothetical protein
MAESYFDFQAARQKEAEDTLRRLEAEKKRMAEEFEARQARMYTEGRTPNPNIPPGDLNTATAQPGIIQNMKSSARQQDVMQRQEAQATQDAAHAEVAAQGTNVLSPVSGLVGGELSTQAGSRDPILTRSPRLTPEEIENQRLRQAGIAQPGLLPEVLPLTDEQLWNMLQRQAGIGDTLQSFEGGL